MLFPVHLCLYVYDCSCQLLDKNSFSNKFSSTSHYRIGDEVWDLKMPLHIKEFDPEKDWRDYIEQVEQYFIAHDLSAKEKEPTKRALFLSGVGSSTYMTLKSLLAPTKPADKKFNEIVALLTKHYSPLPSEVVQSYLFFLESTPTGQVGVCVCGSLTEASQGL